MLGDLDAELALAGKAALVECAPNQRGQVRVHVERGEYVHGHRHGDADEIGESPAAAFRRLRLEMLAAERAAFIEERDNGQIDDEVLREVLRGLDLEEATLNRG